MAHNLDTLVRHRAGYRCEYCRLPQAAVKLRFPVDHIIARQHGGQTMSENLALCCASCNLSKGPNIAGLDPEAGLTRLFNPRTDRWEDHFRFDWATVVGLTAIGRVTVIVLGMNDSYALAVRKSLVADGTFW